MEVAIVGGGLVGRIAAWAVMRAGHRPRIFDPKSNPIVPAGYVFLHHSMDLPLRRHDVHVTHVGTEAGYRKKIYGDAVVDVSFPYENELHKGYSPREAFAWLLGIQDGMHSATPFTTPKQIKDLADDFDRVIVTTPVDKLFPDLEWPFKVNTTVAFELDPGEDLMQGCVYNGIETIPWTRAGAMFGYAFFEFPGKWEDRASIQQIMPGFDADWKGIYVPVKKVMPAPQENWDKIEQEIATGGRIQFTGRYGSWDKSALSHHTYAEVIEWLA